MSKHSLSIKFYPLESGIKGNQIPVYCRITVNRKKAEFNTHINVTLKQWDAAKDRIKGNPEANAILASIESNIRRFRSNIEMQEKPVTAQVLRDLVTERGQDNSSLLDYYTQFQIEIEELPDEFTISTIKKYKTIRVHLEGYLKSKKCSSILMKDFTLSKFSEFEHYLRTVAKLNINTTTKYLKQLKAIFNRALKFGIIESIPFHAFKYKHEQTQREFLTQEEIDKLELFVAPNESMNKVKDVFLFAVYSGLRYSDVNNLKKENLKVDKKGNTWIEFTIVKTEKNISIPLMNKALELVKKYEKEREITGRVLPIISNQKVNAYLKVLGNMAGLNKELTYHMARHTFATTVTLSNDIPIEVVSKMLGHSNISTTQIYAKITNEYLLKTTNELNKKIK